MSFAASVLEPSYAFTGRDSIAQIHDPEPHLIPRAILAALGELKDFQIYGNDYPTPDGSPIRDYIHVSDLAAGHVAAVGRLLDGAPSEKVNMGIGRGYSVSEVISEIQRLTGRSVPHTGGPRRVGDPPSIIADVCKAKNIGFSSALVVSGDRCRDRMALA